MSKTTLTNGRFRLTLPPLAGGLDLAATPEAIADNELADGKNLWFHRGALRTRPGLCCREEGRTVLREPMEGDTFTFAGVTALGASTVVGDIPAQVVAERWSENGKERIRPVRIGGDGIAYPYRDEGNGEMTPFSATHCLVANDENGTPLFFTPEGVFVSGGESMDGRWMSMEEWLYVPLLLVGGFGATQVRNAQVTGIAFEAPNLLTPRFKAQYTTDNDGVYFFLPRRGLDDEPVTATLVDDTGTEHDYTVEAGATESEEEWGYRLHVDRAGGYVWFTADGSPVAPAAFGRSGNLTVTASKSDTTGRRRLLGMRFGVWYGGDSRGLFGGTRLFVAGNPLYPHLVHWSDVNNALYFPATNFAYVGDATDAITAFGKQEDALIIFKERELYAAGYESSPVSAAQLTSGAVGDVTAAAAAFPLTPLSAGIGCDRPATIRLCHDRLVWANRDGRVHMLLAKSVYSGRNIRTLSGRIAPGLEALSTADWDNASAAAQNGWYYLLTGNTVWALHYDTPAFVRYAGYAADRDAQEQLCWFRWDVTLPGVSWQLLTGQEGSAVLYGLKQDGGGLSRLLYTFDGDEDSLPTESGFSAVPIPFSAATKRWDLEAPGTYKQVTGLRLGMAGSARVRVTLTDGDGGAWCSATLTAASIGRLLTGLRRVRRVQLSLFGEGPVALTDAALDGRGTGEVR